MGDDQTKKTGVLFRVSILPLVEHFFSDQNPIRSRVTAVVVGVESWACSDGKLVGRNVVPRTI